MIIVGCKELEVVHEQEVRDGSLIDLRRHKMKSRDLAVEIKTLWRLTKVDIVPVIVGSTGLMHSGFDNDIEKFNLKTMRLDKFQAQKITPHCPKFFSDSLIYTLLSTCLLYTSLSPRDQRGSRMPSSA